MATNACPGIFINSLVRSPLEENTRCEAVECCTQGMGTLSSLKLSSPVGSKSPGMDLLGRDRCNKMPEAHRVCTGAKFGQTQYTLAKRGGMCENGRPRRGAQDPYRRVEQCDWRLGAEAFARTPQVRARPAIFNAGSPPSPINPGNENRPWM